MASQDKKADDVVATAKARFLGIPARKAGLVANLIRGKTVRQALNLLQVTPKPSAVPLVRNLLLSAVSNVDRKQHANTDDLVVTRIFVDVGPMLRRIQPHAMGRAFRIRKRTCHMTIALSE